MGREESWGGEVSQGPGAGCCGAALGGLQDQGWQLREARVQARGFPVSPKMLMLW